MQLIRKYDPLKKVDFRALGTQKSHPTAWELNLTKLYHADLLSEIRVILIEFRLKIVLVFMMG